MMGATDRERERAEAEHAETCAFAEDLAAAHAAGRQAEQRSTIEHFEGWQAKCPGELVPWQVIYLDPDRKPTAAEVTARPGGGVSLPLYPGIPRPIGGDDAVSTLRATLPGGSFEADGSETAVSASWHAFLLERVVTEERQLTESMAWQRQRLRIVRAMRKDLEKKAEPPR